jgi:hypothetical protein
MGTGSRAAAVRNVERTWGRLQSAIVSVRPIPATQTRRAIFPIADCGAIYKLASEPVWIEVGFSIYNVTVVAKPFSSVK